MNSPEPKNQSADADREERRGNGMLNSGHFGEKLTSENTAESFDRAPETETYFDGQRCDQCGEPMTVNITTGVSHHVDEDGNTDHDADGNHVAYTTEGDEPETDDSGEFDFGAADAEIDTLDDSTEAGSARMFELAAAATKALARDTYPDAAAVILEDINDDEDGSPFFVVVSVQNPVGDTLWNGEDNDDLIDGFAEYALMLDRNLDKLEVINRRQGLSKLTF
jgi:hypothetical protein